LEAIEIKTDPIDRIEMILHNIYPAIANGYKEELWTKDEAIGKLITYKEKGHTLAPGIEDEVLRLELEDNLCSDFDRYLDMIELEAGDKLRMYV